MLRHISAASDLLKAIKVNGHYRVGYYDGRIEVWDYDAGIDYVIYFHKRLLYDSCAREVVYELPATLRARRSISGRVLLREMKAAQARLRIQQQQDRDGSW